MTGHPGNVLVSKDLVKNVMCVASSVTEVPIFYGVVIAIPVGESYIHLIPII